MKSIFEMTQEDFNSVPRNDKSPVDIGKIDSIVIIPTGAIHDSGWQCMEFCLADKDWNPICRVGGCSDILHLDGIGGFGDPADDRYVLGVVKPKGWKIDCLPCGYLRLRSRDELYFADYTIVSSANIFAD